MFQTLSKHFLRQIQMFTLSGLKQINRNPSSPKKRNGEQLYTARVYRTQKEFLDGNQEK